MLTRLFLSALLCAGLITMPALHANETFFCQPCVPKKRINGSVLGIVGLSAGLGALAGWAASSGHHHKHSKQNCQSCVPLRDLNQSLEFAFKVLINFFDQPPAGSFVDVTPFAVTPCNEVILGRVQQFQITQPESFLA